MTRRQDRPASRTAFFELLEALRKIDAEFIGEPASDDNSAAIAEGHRFLMHLLGGGLDLFFEADPAAPEFRPTLWAGRKFYGDNPDAIYHSTVIDPRLDYRIRGNTDGAAYVSFTVEGGGDIDARYPPGRVVATRNDTAFAIEPNGDFELIASGVPREGNWLPLEADACSIVSRHYFEGEAPVDRRRRIPLEIDVLERVGGNEGVIAEPAARDGDADGKAAAEVARGLRRVRNFVQGLSLDYAELGPPLDFAALAPNAFSPPSGWSGGTGQAAVDQSNLFARFELAEDESLLIEGRFPACRFANIVTWNRYLQTFEFVRRRSSLNRRQTALEPDGSFRIVLAHQDPGVPNWLDTGGARSGLLFVRYLLPEEPPQALSTRILRRG